MVPSGVAGAGVTAHDNGIWLAGETSVLVGVAAGGTCLVALLALSVVHEVVRQAVARSGGESGVLNAGKTTVWLGVGAGGADSVARNGITIAAGVHGVTWIADTG